MDTSELRTSPGLAYWRFVVERAAEDSFPAAYSTLLAQPHFIEACLQTVRNNVDHHFYSPIVARVARDLRRFFAGVFVLHLESKGELTLATVKTLCRELGLASPGRATALLVQLRVIGFIMPDPVQPDRRARRYIPTPQMRACFQKFFRDQLVAASKIEPETLRVAEHIDDPDVFRAFMQKLTTGMTAMARTQSKNPLTPFAHHTAGMGILYDLALAREEGDTFPPRGPVRLSVTALARKYKVSRAHVSRLLKLAESQGSLKRGADGNTIVICEPLRQTLTEFWCVSLVGTMACAHAALEAVASIEAEAA